MNVDGGDTMTTEDKLRWFVIGFVANYLLIFVMVQLTKWQAFVCWILVCK